MPPTADVVGGVASGGQRATIDVCIWDFPVDIISINSQSHLSTSLGPLHGPDSRRPLVIYDAPVAP